MRCHHYQEEMCYTVVSTLHIKYYVTISEEWLLLVCVYSNVLLYCAVNNDCTIRVYCRIIAKLNMC